MAIVEDKQPLDLEDVNVRRAIAETMVADIDRWCEEYYDEKQRTYLGGSQIGDSCARRLYYSFRHVKKERISGKIQRLFHRGHDEEKRFRLYLEGIGCKFETDQNNQVRVQDCEGHFGGGMDDIGYLPEAFHIPDRCLYEYKTANMDSFNRLRKDGMKSYKPVHWSQMCVYAYKKDLKYGVYVVVDKNSDAIHIEIHKMDLEHGADMVRKASFIITHTTEVAPPKIAMSPANFLCQYCNFKDICHFGAAVEINCRSCMNSVPLMDGKWGCKLYNLEIPPDFIPKGCEHHKGIQ